MICDICLKKIWLWQGMSPTEIQNGRKTEEFHHVSEAIHNSCLDKLALKYVGIKDKKK